MTTSKSTLVACPTCKTKIEWTTKNPHRPFCSDRCRNKDLIAWANEENVVPGNPVYTDALSDELNSDW
ncbi:MAG: DNA gyrase inhibitor YacG [Spongiibacteraceae bacterium]